MVHGVLRKDISGEILKKKKFLPINSSTIYLVEKK
jgi:hypothetical protein